MCVCVCVCVCTHVHVYERVHCTGLKLINSFWCSFEWKSTFQLQYIIIIAVQTSVSVHIMSCILLPCTPTYVHVVIHRHPMGALDGHTFHSISYNIHGLPPGDKMNKEIGVAPAPTHTHTLAHTCKQASKHAHTHTYPCPRYQLAPRISANPVEQTKEASKH